MSEKPIHLASDVHLGAVPPETERAFVRWLKHTADCASELILNGDLFDFWFGVWLGNSRRTHANAPERWPISSMEVFP